MQITSKGAVIFMKSGISIKFDSTSDSTKVSPIGNPHGKFFCKIENTEGLPMAKFVEILNFAKKKKKKLQCGFRIWFSFVEH